MSKARTRNPQEHFPQEHFTFYFLHIVLNIVLHIVLKSFWNMAIFSKDQKSSIQSICTAQTHLENYLKERGKKFPEKILINKLKILIKHRLQRNIFRKNYLRHSPTSKPYNWFHIFELLLLNRSIRPIFFLSTVNCWSASNSSNPRKSLSFPVNLK